MADDATFMLAAIVEARQALAGGNTPFGAAIVGDGRLIACGHNLVVTEWDPTGHGEVVAIRNAARALRTFDLGGMTLYTTCEPCLMCTGALTASRISRVVIGALWRDIPHYIDHPERGSLTALAPYVTYPFEFTTGVLRDDCIALYRRRKRK